jgi:hypothetical protein
MPSCRRTAESDELDPGVVSRAQASSQRGAFDASTVHYRVCLHRTSVSE